MVRVSGVPYEVELPCDSDIIATLEHENNCLRARNERLEEEFKDLHQENDFLRSKIKLLEQECHWLESKTREIRNASKTD
jgi:cell division protein FtsB